MASELRVNLKVTLPPVRDATGRVRVALHRTRAVATPNALRSPNRPEGQRSQRSISVSAGVFSRQIGARGRVPHYPFGSYRKNSIDAHAGGCYGFALG
jgi:hypothetical protein